jgi:hypothetical protein
MAQNGRFYIIPARTLFKNTIFAEKREKSTKICYHSVDCTPQSGDQGPIFGISLCINPHTKFSRGQIMVYNDAFYGFLSNDLFLLMQKKHQQ